MIFIIWTGGTPPFKIADMDLKRCQALWHPIATGNNILPAMAAYRGLPGMEGTATTGIPRTRERTGIRHLKRFEGPARLLHRRGASPRPWRC